MPRPGGSTRARPAVQGGLQGCKRGRDREVVASVARPAIAETAGGLLEHGRTRRSGPAQGRTMASIVASVASMPAVGSSRLSTSRSATTSSGGEPEQCRARRIGSTPWRITASSTRWMAAREGVGSCRVRQRQQGLAAHAPSGVDGDCRVAIDLGRCRRCGGGNGGRCLKLLKCPSGPTRPSTRSTRSQIGSGVRPGSSSSSDESQRDARLPFFGQSRAPPPCRPAVSKASMADG